MHHPRREWTQLVNWPSTQQEPTRKNQFLATIVMQISFFLSIFLFTSTCSSQIELNESQLAKEKNLPHDECGVSRVKHARGRRHSLPGIYGGENVKLGEFPWMALLGYRMLSGYVFRCGGSLITDRYVVTAAHCLNRKTNSQLVKVRLGELDINPNAKDNAKHRDFDVEYVVIHEDWNNYRFTNDIGLIKLRRTVQFSDFIRPICLPPLELRSKSFFGETSVSAGWGETENGRPSSMLLKVDLPVANQRYCKNKIENKFPEFVVDVKVMCAGEEGRDTCQGDSGGPLMWNPKNGTRDKWYLIGVVSYGYGCGIKGYPGVYTRVSHFMPWIMDHIEL